MNQNQMTAEAEADPPLLEDDEVRIWAHDVDVERGATYRYRLRVWVTNPFFRHDAGLIDEQKSLAAEPLLAGEPSEWSDPVNVHHEAYYFITSAQDGGLLGGARAIASVYVFRWGYWRAGTARMEPGDILAADIQSPMLGEMLAAVEPAQEWQPDPHRPGGHARPVAAQAEDPAVAVDQVEYERIPITRDVVLLDVGPSVTANGEKIAYLREETGQVVDRDPEAERRQETFVLVQSSARRGADALKPKEAPAPDDDMNPRPGPAPEHDHGRPEPGGPGGG